LVEWGVDVNTRTDRNATPLYVASQKGFTDIVKFLIESGAIIDCPFQNGYTPLHIACGEKHLDTITLLVEHGADLNAKSRKGETPLQVARKANDSSIVQFLLKRMIQNVLPFFAH